MAIVQGDARIRTNTGAENAYNALISATQRIGNSQLRISTGKRINSAADDVAGYITSRSLQARNGSLKSALLAVGDGKNVTSMSQDSLDNIQNLLSQIKDSAGTASSGSLGTDEKVALAKGAFRLTQQIQTIVDQTVFGGIQLIKGGYSADFLIGWNNDNATALRLSVNLLTNNVDFNTEGATGSVANNFNLNTLTAGNFAGVSGLNMTDLNAVSATDLGIYAASVIETTLTSFSIAFNNINKVASYLGAIEVRLNSQESLLNNQITNYNAAISRIENTDVAQEQLSLVKNQFLQQASLVSLTQANQNPSQFLQLLR